jgi:hypothetical protein
MRVIKLNLIHKNVCHQQSTLSLWRGLMISQINKFEGLTWNWNELLHIIKKACFSMLYCYISGDFIKENARLYATKSVKKYLKSLKKHDINRKYICLKYKIEIYFILLVATPLVKILHLLFTQWNIFQSYMQNKQMFSIY